MGFLWNEFGVCGTSILEKNEWFLVWLKVVLGCFLGADWLRRRTGDKNVKLWSLVWFDGWGDGLSKHGTLVDGWIFTGTWNGFTWNGCLPDF
ncbi:MAG: hypothetical protein EBQ80_03470 [Proteobacteria bacterium]|nr:hypothetical protein [Pseudomonadota bacterium]